MNKSFNEFIELSAIEYHTKQKDYSSLYNLLNRCRVAGYYHMGYYVGKILEKVGEYKFLDELAICAYWIGEYQESYNLCKRLVYMCPEADKDRIIANKNFSAKKLGIKEVFTLEEFKKQTKEEVAKIPYKKYFYQYNDTQKLELAKDMKDIEVYFKKELDLDIYPVYGTLLGMMRDNDFIGWDTDIDMAYLSKYHTNEEVIKEFNNICKFLEEKKLLMHRIKTMSHLHVYAPSKILRIDLWISWIDNNDKYHLVWTMAGEESSSILLPFKTLEFKNQTFHKMNNVEKFLDMQYDNWKIPLDGTATQWAAKRKEVFELEPWHGK